MFRLNGRPKTESRYYKSRALGRKDREPPIGVIAQRFSARSSKGS